MAMEMRLQQKLSQQLVMTPQLQQAIKLLQLSRMELAEVVQQEILENPMLEDTNDARLAETLDRAPGSTGGPEDQPERKDKTQEVQGEVRNEIDWENYLNSYQMAGQGTGGVNRSANDMPSLESTLSSAPSLYDHLGFQLMMTTLSDRQKEIGMVLIGSIDPNGYLKDFDSGFLMEEFECTGDDVEEVIETVQSFDPIGVGARSLAECLLIQAIHQGQDDDVLVKIIKSHLGNIEKRSFPTIAKDLDEPLEEIYEAVKVIMSFDPRPGRQYAADDARYITPDVYIHKVDNDYFVIPNDDGLPKLKISNYYKSALAKNDNAKEYVQDKMRSAQWLIRSIQQRQRTIIKVTESILKFQREFFEKGITHLKPLILKDVAEDIGMHESTISRVTTAKYVHSPQGIFELKYFFNSSISRNNGDDMASQAVKNKIKKLIGSEDGKKPLSDQKLATLLKEDGIDIARRTVAKYREQLGILSSSKRKKMF